MSKQEHTKIITKIAKEEFKPFGILQKGNSRLWFDDNGWYLILIEFQPSAYSKGSMLNIGINFNWNDQDSFSFDIGYRQDVKFIEFKNTEEFSKQIKNLCSIAIEKVLYYREKFKTIDSSKDFIISQNFTENNLWGNYHSATILGLTGNIKLQSQFYENILKSESNADWVKKLQLSIIDLKKVENFKQAIINTILEGRKAKKLPEIQISLNYKNGS